MIKWSLVAVVFAAFGGLAVRSEAQTLEFALKGSVSNISTTELAVLSADVMDGLEATFDVAYQLESAIEKASSADDSFRHFVFDGDESASSSGRLGAHTLARAIEPVLGNYEWISFEFGNGPEEDRLLLQFPITASELFFPEDLFAEVRIALVDFDGQWLNSDSTLDVLEDLDKVDGGEFVISGYSFQRPTFGRQPPTFWIKGDIAEFHVARSVPEPALGTLGVMAVLIVCRNSIRSSRAQGLRRSS